MTRDSANDGRGDSALGASPLRSAEHRRASAERMRRSRERKRLSLRCYMLEIGDRQVDALIRQGCLLVESREDYGAVLEAIYRFLDRSLR